MALQKILTKSSLERMRVIINHCSKVCSARVSTSATSLKPCIHLSKTQALLNEKVCISVTGLKANQRVTLQTYVDEGSKSKSFGSCGHYVADSEGNVSTFEHECHGGTYDGKEPMGLFWSMQSLPGGRPRRILNTDVTRPVDVEISLYPDHVGFDELPWTSPRQPLASSRLSQKFMDEGVKVIPVKEDGVVGTLYLPEGSGPFPAVIDVFGVVPVTPGHRSSLLASNGIASFNLIYVKPEHLVTFPPRLDFTYFLKAFDWLSRHPSVNPNALGGMTSCIGTAYVSIVAWKRPNLRCLVGINSPAHPEGPAQMVEGELVETPGPWQMDRMQEIEGALSMRPTRKVEDTGPSLPYWRHGVKVLQIQAEDDLCINPECLRVSHEAVPQEFRANMEFISYPKAGHILEPPHIPLCRTSMHPISNSMMMWGGEPKAHARAQEDCWPRILDFLKKNLMVDVSAIVDSGRI